MSKVIKLVKNKNYKFDLTSKGDYIILFKNLSGKVEVNILASLINLEMYALYEAKSSKFFKLETIVKHNQPDSSSNILIKGIFLKSSEFNYKGVIRVSKNAQKTKANLLNENLVLSKNTEINSKPYLEIENEDVSVNHGVSITEINEDKEYFLASRGCNSKASTDLLVEDFSKFPPSIELLMKK